MIPLPWLLVGAFAFAGIAGFFGYKIGADVKQGEWDRVELSRAEKIIVRVQREVVEVPKIVTQFVTQKVTVEKEVPHVVEIIRRDIGPDCVLPPKFAGLLVDFARVANGQASSGTDGAGETYGCAELLEATVKDLAAGYENTAKATALQRWAALVSSP